MKPARNQTDYQPIGHPVRMDRYSFAIVVQPVEITMTASDVTMCQPFPTTSIGLFFNLRPESFLNRLRCTAMRSKKRRLPNILAVSFSS